jgi:hypothetical protein
MDFYVIELATTEGSKTIAIGCRHPADLGVEVCRYCEKIGCQLEHPDSWELKLILDDIMMVPTHSQCLLELWWEIQADLENDRVNDLECVACKKSLNLKKGKKSA